MEISDERRMDMLMEKLLELQKKLENIVAALQALIDDLDTL